MSFTRAVQNYGWALGLGGFILGGAAMILVVVAKVPEQAGINVSTEVNERLVPASPGLTSSLDTCKYGEVSRFVLTETTDYKYHAQFGVSILEWPDSPKGKNHIGLLDGVPLTLDTEVEKCLLEKF